MSDIRTELGASGQISLEEASTGDVTALNSTSVNAGDGPDDDPPHAMSEWYSYNHSAAGLSAPSSLSYVANATSNFLITFTEASDTTKVEAEIISNNGTTSFTNADIFNILDGDGDGNGPNYFAVDGSGTTTFNIGPYSSNSTPKVDGSALAPGPNDFVTLKLRSGDNSGNFSSFTSNFTGWTKPSTTSAPSLTVNSTSQITATWSAGTGGASNYKVYVDAGSTVPTTLRTTQSGTSYAQTGLTVNTQYGFRIKAVGGGGDLSDYSSNTSLYTLTNAVQNLAVTATSTTSVTLDWDAPSGGASTYKILYGQISPTSTFIDDLTATTDVVTSLNSGTTYYFKVLAANADGTFESTGASITQATDALPTSWGGITNFSMTGDQGDEVIFSGVKGKTISLSNGSGTSHFEIVGGVTNTDYFAVSSVGSPGTNGTGNSGSGWKTIGQSATLSLAGTYYFSFKSTVSDPGGRGTYSHTFRLDCTNNSVEDQTTITVEEGS